MSNLSYMEKLLDGVEVEWRALGEVAKIGTGSSNRQDESKNGIYPFYVRSKTILKSDTFQFDETAIVIPGEGGIGDIFHYVQGKYALHQRAYRIHVSSDNLSTRFLYHFMSSSFKQYILMKSVGATSISIRKPMLENFEIPIPCPENPEKSLTIQAEIVRILDTFTELTTELTARKKQYHYYRDQLLSFEEGEVGWKTLGELTLPTNNIRWRKTDRPYRYIDLSSVSRESNSIIETSEITTQNAPSRAQKLVEKDDVIFATTRPTQLRLCLINEEYSGEVASTGYCVLRAKVSEVLPKWIYHHLSSSNFCNYAEEN